MGFELTTTDLEGRGSVVVSSNLIHVRIYKDVCLCTKENARLGKLYNYKNPPDIENENLCNIKNMFF